MDPRTEYALKTSTSLKGSQCIPSFQTPGSVQHSCQVRRKRTKPLSVPHHRHLTRITPWRHGSRNAGAGQTAEQQSDGSTRPSLRNVGHHLVAAEGYTQYVAPGTTPIDWARTTGKELWLGYFHRTREPSTHAKHEITAGYSMLFDVFEFRRGAERR
ncbi:uncharacterized protein LAJ45_10133 [Morchella importuna]|uniref:uncharacterized protein n=1 Tax=Morchella importuna TaxID=1174673 RepID=UPI001E8E5345|nr:uncharacterized protein LAJ45_10133 [Morchella importuna]KAH8145810.1 hypothetical protein LAJ45_10133 [Morchella importuna]